ncbi:MAG TPA: rhamnulokinase family protein [Chthoniobacterales bacterium]
MTDRVFLAVDIGAGSGRVLAGIFDGKTLRIENVRRYPNQGIPLPTGWHWNLPQLFAEIVTGLGEARQKYGNALVSVAVDSWGVDYGVVDAGGRLLGLPWMYRDSRNDGMIDAATALVPKEEIYRRTGIQFLPFNTVFQLMAEQRAHSETMRIAERLLFVPDLLTFWLSGKKVTERTIASTSMLLKAGKAEWDLDLAAAVGIPTHLLKPITEPGVLVGELRPELAAQTGCTGLKVVTCGGHDTASAVAGVPAVDANPLFLSSGTWSLIGCELPAPIVTAESAAAGFSNEQGLCGTTRFLNNVTGMWLLQECQRNWRAQGIAIEDGELARRAADARIDSLIDPDHESFAKPCDMPAAITHFCKATGQAEPRYPAETARVIVQSLALRYRELAAQLRAWMPAPPSRLHIVGGGSQNALLNQFTADALDLPVEAGPTEATALGNILAQLLASGEISSLAEGRAIIRASFAQQVFTPQDASQWIDRAGAFAALRR